MNNRITKVTGINYDHLTRTSGYNDYKVEKTKQISGKATRIQREHQEVKDEFARIFEAKKHR